MQIPCLTGDSGGVTTLGDGMKLGVLREQYSGPSKGYGLATIYVRNLSHDLCVPVTSRYHFHMDEPSLTKDTGGTYTYEDFSTDFKDDVFEIPESCPELDKC